MIQQIQRGEYVNFDALYSALTFGQTSRPGFSLLMDNHPELDLPALSFKERSTEKAKITNLGGWLRTWNAFMSIYTQFRPHALPQLLEYLDTITEFANTHPMRHWLAYDRAFRLYMANSPTASWGTENSRIFNRFLRNAPLLSSVNLPVSTSEDTPVSTASTSQSRQQSFRPGPCFNCRNFGHKIADCPYASQSSSTTASSHMNTVSHAPRASAHRAHKGNSVQSPFRAPQRPGDARGTCGDWNLGAPCPPGCRKDHRCSFCGRLHPRYDCKDPRLQDSDQP